MARLTEVTKALARNKYVLLVLSLGLLLLLLPRSSSGAAEAVQQTERTGTGDPLASSGIPLDTECRRLAELLSAMRGVGEVRVLLSHSGAVVVCAGAEDPRVRLTVTEAVAAYTGLGSDQILVLCLDRDTIASQ